MNVRASTLAVCATLAMLAMGPSRAGAQASRIVPGLMGPNALPTIPVEDAAIPPTVVLELGAAAHFSGEGAADRAFTPEFRLVVPFLRVAALEVGGTPLEVWRVTPETRERLGGRALSGVAKGDVGFGARFALLAETDRRPALGLRLLTKSSSGKSLLDRRFTDAPAYAVETLAAKTLRDAGGAVRRVRALAKLGFLSWAQEQGLQDDAIDYGAAVDTTLRSGTELRLELRGYQGYQVNDKPMLACVRVLQPLAARASVTLGVNRGVRSASRGWELLAGVVLTAGTQFGGR